MSQRNPMNERYSVDKHQGKTRKSAASAKPKKMVAGTVTTSSPKKTAKEKKAEQKQARREEQERQREIDRKYYKPDTERYKKLKRIWWASLIGAVVCVCLSWLLREVQPEWIAMVALFLAYGLIIFAFYIDFSKIRKERRAYQDRMVALELEEAKKSKNYAMKKKSVSKGVKASKVLDDAGKKLAEEKDSEAEDGDAGKSKASKGFFSRFSKAKDAPVEQQTEA